MKVRLVSRIAVSINLGLWHALVYCKFLIRFTSGYTATVGWWRIIRLIRGTWWSLHLKNKNVVRKLIWIVLK